MPERSTNYHAKTPGVITRSAAKKAKDEHEQEDDGKLNALREQIENEKAAHIAEISTYKKNYQRLEEKTTLKINSLGTKINYLRNELNYEKAQHERCKNKCLILEEQNKESEEKSAQKYNSLLRRAARYDIFGSTGTSR